VGELKNPLVYKNIIIPTIYLVPNLDFDSSS